MQKPVVRSSWRLVHLVGASAVIGGFFVFLLNWPLLLLGRLNSWCWRVSGIINHWGLTLLKGSQPWWRGDIDIKLPDEVKKGRQGCLFVCNHRSHLDVFILIQAVPGLRILTKHLIFLIPFLGLAAFLFRMIPIRRGRETSFWNAMNKIENGLLNHERVLVFPEMHRCSFGQTELGRFSLAPFQKAIIAQTPIIPIALWGTDYLWPKGIYGIARKGPLVVKSLPVINASEFTDAKKLADQVKDTLQVKISELNRAHPYEVPV